jgi:hypothetical protein
MEIIKDEYFVFIIQSIGLVKNHDLTPACTRRGARRHFWHFLLQRNPFRRRVYAPTQADAPAVGTPLAVMFFCGVKSRKSCETSMPNLTLKILRNEAAIFSAQIKCRCLCMVTDGKAVGTYLT